MGAQRDLMNVDITIGEVRRNATRATTELDKMGKHSPFENVLKHNAFNDDELGLQVLGTGGVEVTARRRLLAREASLRADCEDRLDRARRMTGRRARDDGTGEGKGRTTSTEERGLSRACRGARTWEGNRTRRTTSRTAGRVDCAWWPNPSLRAGAATTTLQGREAHLGPRAARVLSCRPSAERYGEPRRRGPHRPRRTKIRFRG